jgi:lycopene cyclase domain-containing protein
LREENREDDRHGNCNAREGTNSAKYIKFHLDHAENSSNIFPEVCKNANMKQWSYMAMLIFTFCGSAWLEIYLKTGVLRRIKRVAISVLPISVLFLAWDAYAISQGHWFFDREQILGIYGPLDIPLEEYLFFMVIPMAAIFTIEGVTTVKPHWRKDEFGE